ncbi:MAG: hypothetical protein GXO25_07960 [Euryarchaeota archaeon]|nr:hypothetical protein [Euryarchaeota archaeon]
MEYFMKRISEHIGTMRWLFALTALMTGSLISGIDSDLAWASIKTKTLHYPEMDVAWAQQEGGRIAIFLCTKNQGVWSQPEKIQDLAGDDLHPTVDRDQRDRIWLAWTAVDYQNFHIHYSVKEAGDWGTPAAVPTTTENNIAPYLLVIDDTPWLVWAGNNDDDDDIYYSRFIDNQWEPAKMVHPDNTYPDILPRLEVTATGQPVVLWEQYTDDGYIQVSRTWDGSAWLADSADSQQEKMARDKEIVYSVPGRVWDGRQWIKAQNADTEKNSVEEETQDTSTSQTSEKETIQLPDFLQQIKSVYIRFYHP